MNIASDFPRLLFAEGLVPAAVLDPDGTANEITAEEYGGKGLSLHKLISAGLQVPPFIVVTASEFSDYLAENNLTAKWKNHFRGSVDLPKANLSEADWHERLARGRMNAALLEKISAFIAAHAGSAFAVRSSGSLEDGHTMSFAGQYETCLNVQHCADVIVSVQRCWASLFNARALSYLAQHKAISQPPRMAVVVQVMIPAAQSGVSFSINPTSGHDTQVVTEAVRGLGEGLVSGRIAPDRYVIDWYRDTTIDMQLARCDKGVFATTHPPFIEEQTLARAQAEQSVLTPQQISTTTALCVAVQALYGFPVDIEWGWYQQQLWLLQARPITSVQMTCTDQQWTTADFRDGGVSSDVCTPFMWSLYDYVWERAMPSYLRAVNMLPQTLPATWGTMFFARPYWNVGAIKQALALLPGYVEAEFDDDLGIHKNYQGSGHVATNTLSTLVHGARVLLALNHSFKRQLAHCKKFKPQQRSYLETLNAVEPQSLSPARLVEFYRQLVGAGYYQSEGTYFTLIYNNSNYTALFRQKLKKLVPSSDYAALIGGLEDLSHLRQAQDLWQVVQILSQRGHTEFWTTSANDDLLQLYRSTADVAGMDGVRQHIRRFKHHSTRELDILVPRFDEDHSSIFVSIKQLLNSTDLVAPTEIAARQKQRFAEEQVRILSAAPILSRRRLRKALAMMRELLWWREELRDMSTHYYYHIRRFTLYIGQQWLREGKLEDAKDIFFLPVQTLVAELSNPASVDVQALIARNKMYYAGFRHFENPNEVAPRQSMSTLSTASVDGSLGGIGCSQGYVEGVARVITSLADAERLQQGDILVTHFTDPGWTLKFPLLKGVVTESGGMLSHAAVIAREYGIPAVLAVSGATRRIQDGQRIAIDGQQGRIDLLV